MLECQEDPKRQLEQPAPRMKFDTGTTPPIQTSTNHSTIIPSTWKAAPSVLYSNIMLTYCSIPHRDIMKSFMFLQIIPETDKVLHMKKPWQTIQRIHFTIIHRYTKCISTSSRKVCTRTMCLTDMAYLKPRRLAHTHSGGMKGEETGRGALPQLLLQPVSAQMFHLQYLSVPMLLQTGETDCNKKERIKFHQVGFEVLTVVSTKMAASGL
jgi:hypothetical protein